MSDEKEKRPIIVIKRIIKKSGHHGGSWKIAYADFVTAMMAFFLLMWLLSMLNKFQLMGISNYFSKPLKNVFVDNEKNDDMVKKIPAEQTKKYKLQLTKQEKVELDAKSRGAGKAEDGKGEKNNISNQKADAKDGKLIALLKKKLEADLENNKEVKPYKAQLTFEIVKDGLKINLHDLQNKPMFSLGKTDFEVYAKSILQWLSAEINQSNYKITIIGHTDTNPYFNNRNYSNWELSADRANATRRILIQYGMNSNKIIRIQGAADSMLLDQKKGENPINRRIEIIILTDEAVKRLTER
jgi:chemotaxis protein MotB